MTLIGHEEMWNAIHTLKSNKTPGEDGITTKMLKMERYNMQNTARLVNSDYQPHSQGRDKYVPSCYTAFTPLLISGNVLLKVLLIRISDQTEDFLSESQFGFHSGCEIIDSMFIVWKLQNPKSIRSLSTYPSSISRQPSILYGEKPSR